MDITQIVQIVREAGELALKYEGGNCRIDYKSDGTLVTDADKLVGEFVTRRIHGLFPDHLIIQEETVDPKIHTPERLRQGYVWVIDPIDGTTSFREAFHSWGILAGLLYNGEPVEGIAFYPRYQEMFFTDGRKAYWDYEHVKKELTVSAQPDYRNSPLYKDHRMKNLVINVDPLAFQRFDFSDFSGRIFVQTGVYAFTILARGMSSCLLLTPGLDLTDLVSGFAIADKAGAEFRYFSGEPFHVTDLFHLGASDKDIIACRKGDFDRVVQYFTPRN